MKKLIECIQQVDPEAFASRSHGRLGRRMAADGVVAIVSEGPYVLIATVAFRNAPAQQVRIEATSKGVRSSCSCSARKGNVCGHIVACIVHVQARGLLAGHARSI